MVVSFKDPLDVFFTPTALKHCCSNKGAVGMSTRRLAPHTLEGPDRNELGEGRCLSKQPEVKWWHKNTVDGSEIR